MQSIEQRAFKKYHITIGPEYHTNVNKLIIFRLKSFPYHELCYPLTFSF